MTDWGQGWAPPGTGEPFGRVTFCTLRTSGGRKGADVCFLVPDLKTIEFCTAGHFSTKAALDSFPQAKPVASEAMALLLLEMAHGIVKINGHCLLTLRDSGIPRPGSALQRQMFRRECL